MFLDEATITVRSGAGGDGCVSFRREKYIPRGGPDGGSGGRGGSVYLRATSDLTTLGEVSRKAFWEAESGIAGGSNNRTGRDGKDLHIEVPTGTLAREIHPDRPAREGRVLGDFLAEGEVLLVARGGKGGRGNRSFATSTHQTPREAEEGQPGEEKRIYLELKLLADVGLVGLPNAGKSTLLTRISAARPKVADYPFTTLQPYLGIVEAGDFRRITVADLPGLIEGAHKGVGLGTEFLRHIERTRVLVHLVSAESGSAETMAQNYRIVEAELSNYGESLQKKPRIVLASKMDLLPAEERNALLERLSGNLAQPVLPISAATGHGIRELVVAVCRLLWAEE